MSAVIRPERPEDETRIGELVGAAFASPLEPRLVERIRASDLYEPELALVAEVDGAVVGHVMLSGVTLVGEEATWPILILAPLAIHPDHQGRGHGGALVRAVCDRADQLGEPLVVLEGSPRYYPRFGFEPSHRHGIELPLPDWASIDAGQVLRLTAYDPSYRGRVVYSPAFDDLENEE